ncbi:MAG TPA: SMI1/KNR4 family protein [Tepidisphaeraceae bacterium]|nr:SMI1/KNR4 family protein [Tepidisphaeraceae bacterium]
MNPSHRRFFEAYQQCFAPLRTVRTAATPQEMIVRPVVDSPGWVEWKLMPCNVDLADEFAALERQLGHSWPPSFKEWYGSYFTLCMDVSVVALPENPSNAPLRPLQERVAKPDPFDQAARSLGLIPFGSETMMDAGPLCFDPRGGSDPDRWPVTYWDHEWDGTDQQIGPPIFSCFEKLIECCTHYMDAAAGVRASGDDLMSMIALDPDGAGGPGRPYWDCWIKEEA